MKKTLRSTRPMELDSSAAPSRPPAQSSPEPSAIRLGPFEVTHVLGEGAMATVYAARHPVHGVVALKVATEPQFRAHLEREHALLHRFEHPGIPRPLGFLEVAGRTALVMTHLSGEPLGRRLDRGVPRECAGVVISLLAVLDHVHRRGVVHCDVKPQNVLVGSQAKLLDFGIARDVGAPSANAAGEVAGTPAYMAPEVLKGRRVSASTDLYSLGVFLYRCLTGRFPFPTDRALHLAAKEELSCVPPSMIRARIPESVDALLLSMLKPNPNDRPDSSRVRAQLRTILPTLLKRPSSSQAWPIEPGTTQQLAAEIV